MRKIRAGAIKSFSSNGGFTLLEMAIVLAALALVSTAAIPYYIRQAQTAAAQKTAKEVSTIQEAAKWYYVANKVWPASVGTLQTAGFLNPSWTATNPWGNAYSISSNGTSFTVTNTVPTEVAGVLSRALPGVSLLGGTVTSVVPVPGQEASLTSVTNLASSAMTMAQSSAVPPYNITSYLTVAGNTCDRCAGTVCPSGYALVGINIYFSNGAEQVTAYCGRISR